jgi:hypothetical protein
VRPANLGTRLNQGPTRGDQLSLKIEEEAGGCTVVLSAYLDLEKDPEREVRHLCPTDDAQFRVRYFAAVNLGERATILLKKFQNELEKTDPDGISVRRRLREDENSDEGAEQAQKLRDRNRREVRFFLRDFAVDGQLLFQSLFHEVTEINKPRADHDNVKAAIASILKRPHVITIDSPAPFFPWCFLFDQEYDFLAGKNMETGQEESWKLERFWGFRHEIQIMLTQTPGGDFDRERRAEIYAAICHDTDTEKWHDVASHPLRDPERHVIPIDSVVELRDKLRDFPGDCLYFYGHAGPVDDDHNYCWISLNNVELKLPQLVGSGQRPAYRRYPVLIFLNGCRTAPPTELDERSVFGYLCLHGDNKLYCIATVGKVPRRFAARFAQHFWERVLRGKRDASGAIKPESIGRALLNARLDMLHESDNPLGLLYTWFGRPEIVIP